MKTLLFGAAGAALLTISPAAAQPPAQPPAQVHAAHAGMRLETRDQVARHVRKLFARADANHDGFITEQEAAAAGHQMAMHMHERMADRSASPGGLAPQADRGTAFDRLDLNHDGVITRDEFVNAHAQFERREIVIRKRAMPVTGGFEHGQMLQHMFAMADANHDGRLSIDEATAAALHHFDMADSNHDGRLTPDERMRMHRSMMDHSAGWTLVSPQH